MDIVESYGLRQGLNLARQPLITGQLFRPSMRPLGASTYDPTGARIRDLQVTR